MKKITLTKIVMVIPIIFLFSSVALAWDNEKTHRDLSEYAASFSVLGQSNGNCLSNIGFSKGLMQEISGEGKSLIVKKWLSEGADSEDAGNKVDLLLKRARSYNHFHNPLKQWDQAGLNDFYTVPIPYPPYTTKYSMVGESALVWAQNQAYQKQYITLEGDQTWQAIRLNFYKALIGKAPTYRQENFAKVFKGLGHQMHLLQDMSVPAHVRNDAHVGEAVDDWRVKNNRPPGDLYFETWAKKNADKINRFASKPEFPQIDLMKNPNGKLPIAQFYDTDQYTEYFVPGTSLTWGLSEYTNANFVSDDTIFTEKFNKDDRHYFPYPRYTDYSQCYEQFEEPYLSTNKMRKYWRKKPECSGEAINHFVQVGSLFGYWPAWDLQRNSIQLDNSTNKDYAEKLVPRAVGYSAGLLNYFFRGDIRLEYVTSPSLGYVIVNNTDEDLSGLFQVFYDDSSDQRTEITNKQLSIAKKGRSSVFDIATPDNAKEPGKYTLVFKGTMGNETGAVAGYVYTGGTLEITPPSGYVYAIIDGSEEPQQFTKLKAKIRNKTDKEIGAGTLQATARYKTRTDYMPDLSSDPPDISSREEGYSYSCSAMVSVSSLSSESAAEILFDFKSQPIPAGITDLELFVNFNGTIGVESGVVTGKKDLSEPTHHLFWNLTDRFSLYGKLYTNLEILEDPELVKFADLDGNGFYDETEKGEPYIDPHPVTLKIAYYEGDPPEGSLQEAAVVEKMPEGRHIRLISLFDRQNENKLRLTWVDDIYKISIPYKYIFTASRNQSEGGEFIVTRPIEFRTLRSHLSQGVLNCEPAGTNPETRNNYCTYPKAQEQPPEIITPYPTMIKFP